MVDGEIQEPEGRSYVVLRRHATTEIVQRAGEVQDSLLIERVGSVRATSRDNAWAEVKADPTAWVVGLDAGDVVTIGLLPESSWPAFEALAVVARLELAATPFD